VKNIPQKIYLQVDADGETPEDFKGLEVTWAANRVYDTDIEYVLNVEKAAEPMYDTTNNSES
jgi:hypothetical protein